MQSYPCLDECLFMSADLPSDLQLRCHCNHVGESRINKSSLDSSQTSHIAFITWKSNTLLPATPNLEVLVLFNDLHRSFSEGSPASCKAALELEALVFKA